MKLDNVVAVLPVEEFDAARLWYESLLGRAPDMEPMDDTAEWQIAENAWIQVSVNPATAGKTGVVLGVADLDAHMGDLRDAGIDVGDIVEYPGVVKTLDVDDPAGNTITFVQDLQV
ncbi:MAG: VOC family protein [Rhodococcus sp. (in: high G+C Gram-positive bacteria)]